MIPDFSHQDESSKTTLKKKVEVDGKNLVGKL